MAGYVQMIGGCVSCGRLFAFNPLLVPSIRVKGNREPICGPCMEAYNAHREAQGEEPVRILPGAYEAMPEEDLY